jgi:tRNA threonylcarbamoyladenosine biosynthesis protein TsaE
MHIDCPDESATQNVACALARHLPHAAVLYLYGDLGSGKSTFARAFIHALGFQKAVKSPTYTLLEAYALTDGMQAVHMDLYRLADPEEIAFLALDDYDETAKVWLIEWPEKGLGFIPAADVAIHFRMHGNGRFLECQTFNDAAARWFQRCVPDFNPKR